VGNLLLMAPRLPFRLNFAAGAPQKSDAPSSRSHLRAST